MADGHTAMQRMIERVRAVGQIPVTAAGDVARAVSDEARRTTSAGTDPYGVPWQPTQAGEQPLVNVWRHLRVGAIGNTVLMRIGARHIVLHHLGRSRGNVKRPVIPTGKIPKTMARVVKDALRAKFREVVA